MKKSFLVVVPVFAFLAIYPFDCRELAKDAGVFRSEDMGEAWEQLTVNDEVSLVSLNILSMIVDPNDKDIFYAGTRDNGIYKSCCRGDHWYKLEDKNGVLSKRANIYDIAVDPRNSDNIYVGTYQDRRGRMFRSQDGGESWEEVYVVSEEKYAIFAVAVDSYDPSVVYMGTAQGGFLRSTDYGKSWEIMRWFDDVISDIAINPKDTRQVYISTFNEGIYRSNDKGENWISLAEGFEGFSQANRVEDLVINPQDPNILYTGSEYGLLTSKDAGQTWEEVAIIMPPESKPVLSLALGHQNTDHLYYGAGSILYRSFDKGVNWTVHELNSSLNINEIIIDPHRTGVVFVGMHE